MSSKQLIIGLTILTVVAASVNDSCFNEIKNILRTCNVQTHTLQHNLLNNGIKMKIFELSMNGTSKSWQTFSALIEADYTLAIDEKYLRVMRSTEIRSSEYFYIIFTHWLVIKLKRSPLTLLDSPQSAEIVSLIIESIKWNEDNYDDILYPLWKNFVAQRLFHKLSCCQKRRDDVAYVENHNYLNGVLCSYLSVFCTATDLTDFLEIASSQTVGFIVPQLIFYNIVSPENVFNISQRARRRYFLLWFNDERMRLINTAWYGVADGEFQIVTRKNSEIIECFLCSLLNERKTSEIVLVLHSAFSKDKILSFYALKRRNKAPLYGKYVTVDVIQTILRRAVPLLSESRLNRFVSSVWSLCLEFGRTSLMNPVVDVLDADDWGNFSAVDAGSNPDVEQKKRVSG